MLNANDPLAIALQDAEELAQRIANFSANFAMTEYRMAIHTKSIQEYVERVNQTSKCLECDEWVI